MLHTHGYTSIWRRHIESSRKDKVRCDYLLELLFSCINFYFGRHALYKRTAFRHFSHFWARDYCEKRSPRLVESASWEQYTVGDEMRGFFFRILICRLALWEIESISSLTCEKYTVFCQASQKQIFPVT
jgi:hypothetical protein